MRKLKVQQLFTKKEFFVMEEKDDVLVMMNLETGTMHEFAKGLYYKTFNLYYGVKEIVYNLYKIDWMARISAERQKNAWINYYDMYYDNRGLTWEEYISEVGYDGEIYSDFEEFLDTEYQDRDYMKKLMSPAMYEEYLEEITCLWLEEV